MGIREKNGILQVKKMVFKIKLRIKWDITKNSNNKSWMEKATNLLLFLPEYLILKFR